MNILDVFKTKINAVFDDDEQRANELLIELATFFYKVDRRVSLQEQAYMSELMENISWESPISIEAYQNDCIARINGILSSSEDAIHRYLLQLMESLVKEGAVEKAKVIAREISDADGEVADDEVMYLDVVKTFS